MNDDFESEKFRFKIPLVREKAAPAPEKEEPQEVARRDRALETQAAIVAIMKQAKVTTHNELMIQVLDRTKKRGQLDPAEIKKNIERLVVVQSGGFASLTDS